MKSYKKILIGLGIVFVLVSIAAWFFVNRMITKSFPEIDGELVISSLNQSVKIYRDDFGIPYIEAMNENDLFIGLGFVHAQDRMWQMDLLRRAGMGKLSEIFGTKTIKFDMMFRTIGIEELAKKLFTESSQQTQRICSSYAKGINEFLRINKENYQIEFDLLAYKPQKWEPWQTFIMARLMAWELNMGWWTDVVYGQLAEKISHEKLIQIIPEYPVDAPTITRSASAEGGGVRSLYRAPSGDAELKKLSIPTFKSARFIQNYLADFYKLNISFREFMGWYDSQSGSNSWVVSSRRSESGKPILANDPHLIYSLPSKWYIVSLASPTLSVSGVTIPGSPGVVIGKNKELAWGLTNLMLDDCDLFIESLDSTQTKYLFNGYYKNLVTKLDTIKVKDSTDVIFEIKHTHRGPIINQANEFSSDAKIDYALSMSWTGYELSDEVLTFYSISKARIYRDFKNALKHFNAPAQNFLCADIDGNIFYKAAGKIPVRNNTLPLIPKSGKISEFDWKDFVHFEDLPEVLNPTNGFIATNNNLPAHNLSYYIGTLWEPASRAERIHELLTSKEKFSTDDFMKFQNDVVSPHAQKVARYILNAFENAEVKDKNLETALTYFRNWNADMIQYDQTSGIYNYFYSELLRNTFIDEMGEELFKQFVFIGNIPHRVILQLLSKEYNEQIKAADSTGNGQKHIPISWFDNINTEKTETKEEIIRKSLVDAISKLEKEFGNDPKYWQWGKIHQVKFKHPFSGQSPIIDYLVDIGSFEIGGDQTTLLNTSYKLSDPYDNYLGPSMRQIVDLKNIDSSFIIVTSGQSGHITHENYSDQSRMWLKGNYIQFNTSSGAYQKYKLLTLIPEK
jgi:penicillin amidase